MRGYIIQRVKDKLKFNTVTHLYSNYAYTIYDKDDNVLLRQLVKDIIYLNSINSQYEIKEVRLSIKESLEIK